MQRRSNDKVAAIIEFQLPLAAAISNLDVGTSDYELLLERMLRRNDDSPAAAEAEHQALDRTKARITADFARSEALLDRALVDPRTEGADRLVLARVQRSLSYLKRQQAPFFALGEEVLAAHTAGRAADARALSRAVRAVRAVVQRGPARGAGRADRAGPRLDREHLCAGAARPPPEPGPLRGGAGDGPRPQRRGREKPGPGPPAPRRRGQGHRGGRPRGDGAGDEQGRDRPARRGLQPHGSRSCAPRSGSRTPSGSTSTPAWSPGSSTPRRRTWTRRSAASPPSSSPI